MVELIEGDGIIHRRSHQWRAGCVVIDRGFFTSEVRTSYGHHAGEKRLDRQRFSSQMRWLDTKANPSNPSNATTKEASDEAPEIRSRFLVDASTVAHLLSIGCWSMRMALAGFLGCQDRM